jgi:hypothetical protein
MKTSKHIAKKIDRLPKNYVFTYVDFVDEVNGKEAVIKALNRLVVSGKIAKLSKGKFYKPETTIFGVLQPNQTQTVKDLLEDTGKIVGYLTGFSIYNQLGLTTQVSNTIQISRNSIRPSFRRERFTITFIKQKNTITKNTIPLLQILDAIRYIKKIPDTDTVSAVKRFIVILSDLQEKDRTIIVRLAQKYPSATRALLGAMLEEIGETLLTKQLRKSLNPITTYKFSKIKQVLPNAEKWSIKE